jgi:hypothetical protein
MHNAGSTLRRHSSCTFDPKLHFSPLHSSPALGQLPRSRTWQLQLKHVHHKHKFWSTYLRLLLHSYKYPTLVIDQYHFSHTLISLQSYIRYIVIHLSYFSHSWVLPWRRFDMPDFPYCFCLLLQGMRSPVLSIQNNYHSYREIQMQGGGKIGKEYLCSDPRKS